MPQKRDPENPTTELLQQAGAMRSLARNLLGDRDAATEAAHDVWLAAGESKQSDSYVRASLRNRLRDWRRSGARRRQREGLAANREAHAATDDIVAQAEVRQRVIEAVKSLAEPLRTTIWLRFFDDLPPRVIAKRMRVPVNTVRSRVRLGVEALRRRLDHMHDGDRSRWRAALLPAAGWPLALAVVPLLGVLTMKKVMVLAGAAALAFFGGDTALQWLNPVVAAPANGAAEVAEAPISVETDEPQRDPNREDAGGSGLPVPNANFAVQGTVELRMVADGSLAAAGNGTLELHDDDSGEVRVVDVVDGRFRLEQTAKARLFVERLSLDRWSTQLKADHLQCSPEQLQIVLEANAYPAGRTHFVDATTLQPLVGVDVVRIWTSPFEEELDALGLMGPTSPCLQGASSPCFVTGNAREGEYCASAPGYAWQQFAIDHEHGGDRIVALHPGGDAAITIRNAPTEVVGRLRVRQRGKCIRELQVSGHQMRVDRLPVGPLAVSIEYGERDAAKGHRHAVAEQAFAITAGSRTDLVLDCTGTPPPSGPLREVHGTLTVGKAWGDAYTRIWLIPSDRAPLQGEVAAVASKRRKWPLQRAEPWHCTKVLPGRYRLLVNGFGLERDIEVPATGPVPLIEIEAPEPVVSEVAVVMRGSGDPGHSSSMYLLQRGPDGVDRFGVRGRYIDGSRWSFRSLPGDYELVAFTPGRTVAKLTVQEGSRHQIFFERRYGTLLVFRSGLAHVPVDPADVQLTSANPAARVTQCVDVGFRLSTHFTHKGLYRLRVAIPGYRPLDTVVTIGDGWGTTEVHLEQR